MKLTSVLLSVALLVVSKQACCQGCTVSAVPVRFGDYIYINRTPVDGIGSIKINCFPGIAYSAKLGPGEYAGAGFHPRRMRSTAGGETLNYNLYRDSVRTVVWGDGTNNSFIHTGVGVGRNQTYNIYGRLPEGQNVRPGIYRDSITVTVEW